MASLNISLFLDDNKDSVTEPDQQVAADGSYSYSFSSMLSDSEQRLQSEPDSNQNPEPEPELDPDPKLAQDRLGVLHHVLSPVPVVESCLDTVFLPLAGGSKLVSLLTALSSSETGSAARESRMFSASARDQRATFWGTYMQNKLLSFVFAKCLALDVAMPLLTPITRLPDLGFAIESSADGVIRNQVAGHDTVYLEIKAPVSPGLPVLMRATDYVQIQCHLSAPENRAALCLYLVWSPSGMVLNSVSFDVEFFENTLKPLLVELKKRESLSLQETKSPRSAVISLDNLREMQAESIIRSVRKICRVISRPDCSAQYAKGLLRWFVDPNKFFVNLTRTPDHALLASQIQNAWAWNHLTDTFALFPLIFFLLNKYTNSNFFF